jgi:hypothetical protein
MSKKENKEHSVEIPAVVKTPDELLKKLEKARVISSIQQEGYVPPTVRQAPEKISDEDRTALNELKTKRDLALANAKLALSQSENLELANNNLILQLAMRYKLNDGDRVGEDGVITRIEQGENK